MKVRFLIGMGSLSIVEPVLNFDSTISYHNCIGETRITIDEFSVTKERYVILTNPPLPITLFTEWHAKRSTPLVYLIAIPQSLLKSIIKSPVSHQCEALVERGGQQSS